MDADMIPYFRNLSSALKEAMLDTPVVCLLGPRQCGKTTLAMSLEQERGYISLDEYLCYIDIMMYGSEDEKLVQSF
jgi:predicted AAA+ superfamily ATPase